MPDARPFRSQAHRVRFARRPTAAARVPLVAALIVAGAAIASAVPAIGGRGDGFADRVSSAGTLAGGPAVATAGPSLAAAVGAEVAPPGDPGVGAWAPIVDEAAGSAVRLTWYTVKAGDTLYGIATQHGLRLSTVMWANDLTGPLIHIGQVLRLPPADGTLVTVKADDTLASVAAATGVDAAVIADFNGLTARSLVAGEVLLIPGGTGPAISLPTPTPRPSPRVATGTTCSGCGFRPLLWPVPGGQISQGFGCTGFWAEPPFGDCAHYHGGIDISAPAGTPILAAAAGTVSLAGWTDNGGGNEVCIANGGGYTTCYHHLASFAVVAGQAVARGQPVGGVGATGNATGPHLHFEIWIGPVWAGGYRVNPLDEF